MASDTEDASWIPDEHVNACSVCHVEFTVVNRRHHCRACGNVVCGACSSHRIELRPGGPKERVCDRCEVNFTEQGLSTAEQLKAEKDMSVRLKASLKERQHELSEFRTFLASLSLGAQGAETHDDTQRLKNNLVISVKAKVEELLKLRSEIDKERQALMAAERDARALARRTLAAEAEAKRSSELQREISEFQELANKQDVLIDKLRERVARTENFALTSASSTPPSSPPPGLRSSDPRVSVLTVGARPPEESSFCNNKCCVIS